MSPLIKPACKILMTILGVVTFLNITPAVANETFVEKTKVYGIIKPGKISSLIAVNQGIVTQIQSVGSPVKQNDPVVVVIEKETTRPYRSTIQGVISKLHVTTGAAITPGMPLATVIDPNDKLIELSISPQEARKISLGSKVFTQDQKYFGSVDKMSPLVDPDTGAIISYIKPEGKVPSFIGDVLPLFIQLRIISDCSKIIPVSEMDPNDLELHVEAYSGDQVCLKKIKKQ